MSTACRFFLQGNCRFGDNCRFAHPYSEHEEEFEEYDRYGGPVKTQNQRQQNNFNRYGQERYSRYDQYYKENQSQHHQDERESYSHNKFDRRYNSVERYNQHASYVPSERYVQNQRHEAYEKGHENPRYASNNRHSDDTYTGNRFRWLSPEYNKQVHSRSSKVETTDHHSTYVATSIPKSKTSFSFKLAEAEINQAQPHTSRKEVFDTDMRSVTEEVISWEEGKQWPFSCFGPFSDRNFPGFDDISPEELRNYAYNSRKKNTYSHHVTAINSALQDIRNKWEAIKSSSSEVNDIVMKIKHGQDVSSQNAVNRIFGKNQLQQQYATSDDSKVAGGNFSSGKSSASTFRFELPPENATTKPPSSFASEVYSGLDDLSDDQKQQFEAMTFSLGKIPTLPPAQVFCF